MSGPTPHHQEQLRLRRSLSALSMRLRRTPQEQRADEPRFVSYDMLRERDGSTVRRKKVIVMSGGCSVPTCTMCPFTNENNYGLETDPRSLLEQVASVLRRTDDEPDYDVLSLYNDGSFFAPREVPRDVQLAIAESVSRAGVRRLIVESLPQFITPAVLAPFVEALGDVRLEIGIGLQSADDLVRETLVNTRISRTAFERAVAAMGEFGVVPKIYLMVKPPFLRDDEAVTDVVDSVRYVRSLGVEGVTLCPTRVSRNTVAWQLWQAGSYRPPNLWTIVETVRRVHPLTPVRIAGVNLRGEDFESVVSDSCPECADRVVHGLFAYSDSGELADLPGGCACWQGFEPAELDHAAITARARHQLDDVLGTFEKVG
ncbi:hypothetical protein [Streptomyces chartreusis]|uniref:hypothetical protein n=1 Tax=Streptomyces chartreusis TaxID=1969 RepID=UPI00339F0464